MLLSIPSPSSGELHLGPLKVHYYGLMIALGVVAAVWLAGKRWEQRGGQREDISNLALLCVPAGLIGTRIYHVVTDYQKLYCGPPTCPKQVLWDAFKIWDGGLGIPGGIAAGVIAGVIFAKVKRFNLLVGFDVVAPAIALAQAIGRWGNWFNQELFGRPTSLPWGLEIDPIHRPARFIGSETFHPAFLYESLWNLGVVALILWLDRRRRLKPGRLFAVYLGGYFLGRMWIEALRADNAAMVGPLRWNFLLSLIMVVVSTVWFLWRGPLTAAGSPQPGAYLVAADHLSAESGPDLQGPGPEPPGSDSDEADVAVGVEPPEGAGGAEVSDAPA